MFSKRKSKINEARLKSYKDYVLSIIEDKYMIKRTEHEKLNGINKVHKILLSSMQQKIFENVSDSTHPIDNYPNRYFFDRWTIPNCKYCSTNFKFLEYGF